MQSKSNSFLEKLVEALLYLYGCDNLLKLYYVFKNINRFIVLTHHTSERISCETEECWETGYRFMTSITKQLGTRCQYVQALLNNNNKTINV